MDDLGEEGIPKLRPDAAAVFKRRLTIDRESHGFGQSGRLQKGRKCGDPEVAEDKVEEARGCFSQAVVQEKPIEWGNQGGA
jgi:hypothetical protein